jgi:lipoprotein-releasing system ATP-binding protein
MNKPIIHCQNLAKNFKDGQLFIEVLKNINLTIYPGEQVAIVGASGSGKSTLLHLLGGLEKPTAGEIYIQGQNINQLTEKVRCQLRNQTLGFIYQFHHLLPEFTVLENVCIPLLINKIAPKLAIEKAEALLDKLGILQRKQHKLAEISGGERQRAAIARALVNNPKCILADEPTGNLDQQTAETVYAAMLAVNRDYQTSLVLVTHDRHLAAKMDRILQLEQGKFLV